MALIKDVAHAKVTQEAQSIYVYLPSKREHSSKKSRQTQENRTAIAMRINVSLKLGSVVMGPECDVGIGFNTEIRQYLDWITEQSEVEVRLVSWVDDKGDEGSEVIRCHE